MDNGDSLNGPMSLPLLLPTLPGLMGGIVILPIVRGLRLNDPGISINERFFGEPSRDDDIFFGVFKFFSSVSSKDFDLMFSFVFGSHLTQVLFSLFIPYLKLLTLNSFRVPLNNTAT